MWNVYTKENKILKNTVSLYLFNITKMILPLITLPYLTHVLSKETYGIVTYVKAVMQYMQLLVDFGFLVCGTKDIVNVKSNKSEIYKENNAIFTARVILGICAGIITIFCAFHLPILQDYKVFTCLSFVPVFLTCLLFDYLFRGLEKMYVITCRYVLMRLLATVLTLLCVKNNSDIILIPIFDIIGSLLAVLLVFFELKKNDITVKLCPIKFAVRKIKEATLYFLSDFATTAFTALNTLLIGIYMDKVQVAYWSVCAQLIGAAQALYSPIINGIYPTMVREKEAKLIKKTLALFMPIVIAGCLFTLIEANRIIALIVGTQYLSAAKTLRNLVPVLLFSFPAMLYGWPALGAINKVKEVTTSTIFAAVVQCLGVLLLVCFDRMSLVNVALIRCVAEICLFSIRFFYYSKYKNLFVDVKCI